MAAEVRKLPLVGVSQEDSHTHQGSEWLSAHSASSHLGHPMEVGHPHPPNLTWKHAEKELLWIEIRGFPLRHREVRVGVCMYHSEAMLSTDPSDTPPSP